MSYIHQYKCSTNAESRKGSELTTYMYFKNQVYKQRNQDKLYSCLADTPKFYRRRPLSREQKESGLLRTFLVSSICLRIQENTAFPFQHHTFLKGFNSGESWGQIQSPNLMTIKKVIPMKIIPSFSGECKRIFRLILLSFVLFSVMKFPSLTLSFSGRLW